MPQLSHFDEAGAARMVDVSDKATTDRVAIARGRVDMAAETVDMARSGTSRKGDVLGIARIAGIMAAKKTSELVPLCHPVFLSGVTVDLSIGSGRNCIEIEATARTSGQTGVEMEAMTAVSVAALTIYDMLKSADRSMRIGDIRLVLKDGGKSGRFEAV